MDRVLSAESRPCRFPMHACTHAHMQPEQGLGLYLYICEPSLQRLGGENTQKTQIDSSHCRRTRRLDVGFCSLAEVKKPVLMFFLHILLPHIHVLHRMKCDTFL